MKKILMAATLLATLGAASAQSGTVELGLTGGYSGGLGGEAFVHVPNVAGPVGVKLSGSYSAADGINDSAILGLGTVGDIIGSGIVTESGSHTVLGLDGTYRLGQIAHGADATLYAGGRYSMFSASLNATDGTGSMTYSSNAFGVGAGLQVAYPVARSVSLVGDMGVDQFFDGDITYRDSITGTSETSKPGDANYSTQNNLLNQPGTVFKAKVGVKIRL